MDLGCYNSNPNNPELLCGQLFKKRTLQNRELLVKLATAGLSDGTPLVFFRVVRVFPFPVPRRSPKSLATHPLPIFEMSSSLARVSTLSKNDEAIYSNRHVARVGLANCGF